MSTTTEFYKNMLDNNICEAVVDGPTGPSVILCTLNPQWMNKAVSLQLTNNPTQNDTFYVWNISAQCWDHFRLSQLKSFKLVTSTSPLVDTISKPKSRAASSAYAPVQRANKPTTNHTMNYIANLRSQYTQKLLTGVYTVKFLKLDGTTRIMQATLQPSIIGTMGLTPTKETLVSDLNDLKVIDVDAKGWRTIKIDKILEFNEPNMATPASTTNNRTFFVDQLQAGPCIVEFEKADGTRRVMKATLVAEAIEQLGLTPTGTKSYTIDENVIRVVDLEKKAWRAFNVDRVYTLTPIVTQRVTMLTAS